MGSDQLTTLELKGPKHSQHLQAPPRDAQGMVEMKLEGLAPGRRYRYDLKAGEIRWSGRFHTPPPSGMPFTFLIYGDNRSDHEAHKAVVKSMLAQDPDFCINTGDLVGHGDRPELWDRFFRISTPLLKIAPLYPSYGNHDVHGNGPTLYKRFFALPGAEYYYTFTWGNLRLLALDTEIHTAQGHALDKAQFQWALKEVKAAQADPKIDHILAFGHRGPFSGNPRRKGNLSLRPQLKALYEAGLDLIATGHDHFYERGRARYGLNYMVVGGGGAPLYVNKGPRKEPEYEAFYGRSLHSFVRVRVSGKVLSSCALDVSKQSFDCVSFNAEEPRGVAPQPPKQIPAP